MLTRRLPPLSLKARLGLAAGLLTLTTLLTAAMVVLGMAQVSDRLDSALAAERRLERVQPRQRLRRQGRPGQHTLPQDGPRKEMKTSKTHSELEIRTQIIN